MTEKKKPLTVDNVAYDIQWDRFYPGTSFMVPCLDPESAKKEVEARLKEDYPKSYIIQVVIEDLVQGLRIWRI